MVGRRCTSRSPVRLKSTIGSHRYHYSRGGAPVEAMRVQAAEAEAGTRRPGCAIGLVTSTLTKGFRLRLSRSSARALPHHRRWPSYRSACPGELEAHAVSE